MRFGLGGAVCAVAFVLLSCGSSTTTRVGQRRAVASDGVVAVGEPLPAHPTQVTGRPSTVELGVKDPARPALPSLLLALVHGVRREPRDICFGTYTANQAPMDGDVGCQVVGKAPVAIALGENFIPRSVPLARFVAIYGQADREVAHVELLGPGSRRRLLPLSAHRLFLAAFSPSVRGVVQLRAQLADGSAFSHTFSLPVTKSESGAWPRTRRHGAVFDYEVGENITTESYRTVRRRFGAPLKTLIKPGNVRCVYYDVVGYTTGWVFCFKGEKMLGAAGSQTPPPGVN